MSDQIEHKNGLIYLVKLRVSEYIEVLKLQERLRLRVSKEDLPGILLLLEHPHIYTLGRRASSKDILIPQQKIDELGISVHQIDRGGEVTYHGPGQLVGYPIINLRRIGIGPLVYVRSLEKMLIDALSDLSIKSESDGYPTGVWTQGKKIAAIGVRVSQGVTTHGFAVNVNCDLKYFDNIVPCGLSHCGITSIFDQGKTVSMNSFSNSVASHFSKKFEVALELKELLDIGEIDIKLDVDKSSHWI